MVFNDSLLGAGFPIIGGNRVNLAMCVIWVYGLGKLFPLCWIYSLVWCLIYFFVSASNCIPGSIRQVEMPFLTHQSTSFFFHNFHVSLKFCSSACNKLFMVNVSNYHIHFFGVPTAVHSEFSFWSVSGTTFCWFTWQSRPCIAAFEEVFIFGCSALLCHSGNFLFWAARGSVAPTPRRVAFQATVVCRAQKKKRQKKPYPWKSKGMPQQSTHPCSFRINPERVKFLFLGWDMVRALCLCGYAAVLFVLYE